MCIRDRNQIVGRVDRDFEGLADSQSVLSGMYQALADMRADLAEMIEDGLAPVGLLDHHARLLAAAHSYVLDVYKRQPRDCARGSLPPEYAAGLHVMARRVATVTLPGKRLILSPG